ncbi:GIY-YIG nuclease family protein [Permianibacter aggregans]|uniref:Uncharacterized protein DUF4357 n=1 Tax=Permianibacter aggregans TaxID=1510150 RepID=A0A4R6UFP1_9GAMM|nr:GIY-YIG nuclease family protein [Permianibacter aggregans]QGX38453.1 GIY-YIG nuclease family protein [Permianibacter aggregans]TDQ45568.1 uncharacterized protein DUF4357 [Permianibacter aggregans]
MGKQIRIYLADGTSTGVRHAEITNWSGQAIACPRTRFGELKDWAEIKRAGVYFLFGVNEESGEEAVYIGESDLVLDRLTSHLSGKDFWNELVAFTSKDDNLTKGHVKYLESKLIQLALAAGRHLVTNTTSPQLPTLPRADRDAMDDYLGSMRSLLGVLGHKVLEPYTRPTHNSKSETKNDANTLEPRRNEVSELSITPQAPELFFFSTSEIKASAQKTDEGIVVLKGSEATLKIQSSLSPGYRSLKEKLVASGLLVQHGSKLVLTKDYLFSSPSQAAAVLAGYAINGRDCWRLADGRTYGQYEQTISEGLRAQMLKELDALS